MTNSVSDSSLRPCNGLMEMNKMIECKVLVSQIKTCNIMNNSEDMCVWNVVLTLMCVETVKMYYLVGTC